MKQKKPRILILLMSANTQFFKGQMEDCKKTWLSVLDDGKYKEHFDKYVDFIDWYYYDADFKRKCALDDEGNTSLYNIKRNNNVVIDENDSHHLINVMFNDKDTFNKTYDVLEYVDKKYNGEYDYIVRTNTSTYINLPLLSYILYREFNCENVTKKQQTTYGTDLMSLYSTECPNPSDIYIRGNCMVFTRFEVEEIILKYGKLYTTGCIENEEASTFVDDVCINNILNNYYNDFKRTDSNGNRNFDYLNHIYCLPQMWYKCIEMEDEEPLQIDIHHTWSRNGYGQYFDENSIDKYKHAVAVQIRTYYTPKGREYSEKKHYYELHEKMCTDVYVDYSENKLISIYNKIEEYSKNPDVWLQGNLPYMKQSWLVNTITSSDSMSVNDDDKYETFVNRCFQLTPRDHSSWKWIKKLLESKGYNVGEYIKC